MYSKCRKLSKVSSFLRKFSWLMIFHHQSIIVYIHQLIGLRCCRFIIYEARSTKWGMCSPVLPHWGLLFFCVSHIVWYYREVSHENHLIDCSRFWTGIIRSPPSPPLPRLVKVSESSYLSTEWGFDTQLGHHICVTTVTAIIIHCKPNSSPLYYY